MSRFTEVERLILRTAADRLAEFTLEHPGVYDYGSENLIRDLREMEAKS